MSSGDRDDRSALVVLGLIITSLILVSVLGLWARHEAEHQKRCYADATVNSKQVEHYDTICPDDHVFFGDGYAQWLMALFAAAATGTSIWAVLLLRDTLKATRDAVKAADDAVEVTREMGQQQMRAWIGFSDWQIRAFGEEGKVDRYRFDVHFLNRGSTPALRAETVRDIVTKIDDPDLTFDNDAPPATLSPNAHFQVSPYDFTPEAIFETSETPAILKAAIRYQTIFDKDVYCRTTVTLKIRYIGKATLEQVKAGAVVPHNLFVEVGSPLDVMT